MSTEDANVYILNCSSFSVWLFLFTLSSYCFNGKQISSSQRHPICICIGFRLIIFYFWLFYTALTRECFTNCSTNQMCGNKNKRLVNNFERYCEMNSPSAAHHSTADRVESLAISIPFSTFVWGRSEICWYNKEWKISTILFILQEATDALWLVPVKSAICKPWTFIKHTNTPLKSIAHYIVIIVAENKNSCELWITAMRWSSIPNGH